MTTITQLIAPCKAPAYAGQNIYATLYATSSRKLMGMQVYVITEFVLAGERYGWDVFKNREWKTKAGALRAALKFGANVLRVDE